MAKCMASFFWPSKYIIKGLAKISIPTTAAESTNNNRIVIGAKILAGKERSACEFINQATKVI